MKPFAFGMLVSFVELLCFFSVAFVVLAFFLHVGDAVPVFLTELWVSGLLLWAPSQKPEPQA